MGISPTITLYEEGPNIDNGIDLHFYFKFLEVNTLLDIKIENFEIINSESSLRHYVVPDHLTIELFNQSHYRSNQFHYQKKI